VASFSFVCIPQFFEFFFVIFFFFHSTKMEKVVEVAKKVEEGGSQKAGEEQRKEKVRPWITVRDYQSSDLQAILRIWNAALSRDPITLSRFVSSILADPDLQFPLGSSDDHSLTSSCGLFVACINDVPVGFIRAIVRRVPNDRVGLEPSDGFIPVIAVDP